MPSTLATPVGQDMLSGNPPPAAAGPTFAGMTRGGPAGAPPPDQTAGMSQIGTAAVRMAMEIDQALKVLAQQIPTLMPWVQKVTLELRSQLGQALNAGAAPTSPLPAGRDAGAFPDGGGRL